MKYFTCDPKYKENIVIKPISPRVTVVLLVLKATNSSKILYRIAFSWMSCKYGKILPISSKEEVQF